MLPRKAILASPFLLLAFAVASQPADAPLASGQVASGAPAATTTAPVVVDGATLFRVRGIVAYSAVRRAEETAATIERIAEDSTLQPDVVRVEEQPSGSRIVAGDQQIMVVLDADAELEGVARSTLASVYAKRIRETIAAYRDARTAEALSRAGLKIALAAVGLLLFFLLGMRGFRRLEATLDQTLRARLQGLEAQSYQIVRAAQMWSAVQHTARTLWYGVCLVVILLFIEFTLVSLPWTRRAGYNLLQLVLDPLRVMGRGLVSSVPDLLFLLVLVLVVRYLLQAVRLFFAGIAAGAVKFRNFDADWAWPTYRFVKVAVIAFAVVVAFPYIPGSGSEAFRGVSVFLGVMFSLGSSSVISNIIAGYSITYRRAFKVGDRIQVGDHLGDVVEARLLATQLRTAKNETIVVPNSLILNSSVVNYSQPAREGQLVLHTTVGIGYETPWRQVEAMLLEAAARTDGVLMEPKPFVLQKSLGDFCITYEINVFCGDAGRMFPLYSALHRSILDVFNEYGVQIMTPAYEGDPQTPKVVPRERWYDAPAAPDKQDP